MLTLFMFLLCLALCATAFAQSTSATFDHIDVRVEGTITLTVNGTTYANIPITVLQSPLSVTVPGYGTYSTGWSTRTDHDLTEYTTRASLPGSLDIRGFTVNAVVQLQLTTAQKQAEDWAAVLGNSNYQIQITNYNPKENVCFAKSGYDIFIAEEDILTYVQNGSLKITKTSNQPGSFVFRYTLAGGEAKEATITLTENNLSGGVYRGSVTIPNLPLGSYTVVETQAQNVSGYDLSTSYSPASGKVTVAAGSTAEVEVNNSYTQQAGSLKITKTSNQPGSFVFRYTLAGGEAKETTITLTENNLSGGLYRGSVTIADLPLGSYTVVETQAQTVSGYDLSTSYSPTDGTVTVAAGGTAEVEVNNSYTQQTGSLKITKTSNLPGSFVFRYALAGAEEKEATITLTENSLSGGVYTGSVTISGLPIGSYTVTETGYSLSGHSVEDYAVSTTPSVSQNVAVKKNETTGAAFNNAFTKNGPYTVEIPIEKIVKVTGNTTPGNVGFTFEVYGYAEGALSSLGNMSILTAGAGTYTGKLTLNVSSYTKLQALSEGFYIREVNGKLANWAYSDAVWFVNFSMEDMGANGAVKTVTICRVENNAATGSPVSKASFTNTYSYYEDLGVNISVTKRWVGESVSQVYVQLYANNTAYGPVVTLSAANSWSYTWYSMKGNYTWTVREVNAPVGYVSTVSQSGLNFTITNTRISVTPPQTGSTSFLGFALVGLGLGVLRARVLRGRRRQPHTH